jgi:cytochrome c oxidase subunit 2
MTACRNAAWIATSLLLALASPLLAVEDLSMFRPVSPPGEAIRSFTVLVLVIVTVISLLVEGVLIYSLFRFRRPPASSTNEPPQVYGSMPIEIAWTAAPALVVFILILVIIRTTSDVAVGPDPEQPGSQPLHVTVIGRQWWWEFIYERYADRDLGFTTANELHVPASEDGTPRPVFLTLKSADVCHSFWVPRLTGKTDLIPGRTNHMWFQTAKTGPFVGQCAEYCGTQHANMLLRVHVDPPGDFELWLSAQARPAVDAPAVSKGREVFLSQSCINCHRVRGTKAEGTYAPDLTHLMSRRTLASGMIPNDRERLRLWVINPQKIKPGCLMPAFGLPEQEVDQLVDYLLSLR